MPHDTYADATQAQMIPRTASCATSVNPLRLASSAWTGTSVEHAIAAETKLLDRYVVTPFKLGWVPIELPSLGLGRQYINTIDINSDAEAGKNAPPIVYLHGAGAGLGFAYRNYDTLAGLNGVRRRVLGLDWLGQAGSSRPSFPYGGAFRAPAWSLPEKEQIDAAINFSVVSLEAWRVAVGLQQFDLIAHSMGGYLATQYAMTYPHRVRRLVLVSPVGWADKPSGELARGRAGGLFGALWDAGVGNFGLLKTLGRFASGAAKNIVVGRLGIRDEEERKLVQDYFWSLIASQPLSADKNINYLLEPYFSPAPFGFYAKRPVCTEPAERLRKLPPTTLLYGSHDLHYIPTMPEAIKAVANHASCTMKIVQGSDHHIYIDNPRKFHEHVAQALGA